MFKINPNPTFTSTVSITVAGADALASLGVTWRHKGRAALAAWLRQGNAAPPATPSNAAQAAAAAPAQAEAATPALAGDAAWLAEVMAGWDGPVDAAGQPVAFDAVALAALLDAYPPAGRELLDAYLSAMTESRAKN